MTDPDAARAGPIALGAGDPRVNRLRAVERRPAGGAFYPLGNRCRRLAETHGYDT